MKQESPKNVTPGIVSSDNEEKATEFNSKPLIKRKGRVFVSDEEEEEQVDTENNIRDGGMLLFVFLSLFWKELRILEHRGW